MHPDYPNTSVNNPLSHTYSNIEGVTRNEVFTYEYNDQGLPTVILIDKNENKNGTEQNLSSQSRMISYECQ